MKNHSKRNIGSVILSVLAWILLAASILLLTSVAVQRYQGVKLSKLFGWSYAVVLTGSMEPEIPVGSLVFIQEQDSYQPGDIVTYENPNMSQPITHRIISVDAKQTITKGDANNTHDSPIQQNQIYGKVQHILPGIGQTILWLQDNLILLFLIPMGLIFIWSLFPETTRKDAKHNE